MQIRIQLTSSKLKLNKRQSIRQSNTNFGRFRCVLGFFFFFFFFWISAGIGCFGRYRPIPADLGRYRPIQARVGPNRLASARVEAVSARVGARRSRIGSRRRASVKTTWEPRGPTRPDARAAASLARRHVPPCRTRVRHLRCRVRASQVLMPHTIDNPNLLKSEQSLFKAWLKKYCKYRGKGNPIEEKLHLP